MRPKCLQFLVICVLGQGCGMVRNTIRAVVIEPIHYCEDRWQDHRLECRHRALAEEAARELQANDEAQRYSEDYVMGFKEGYVDYLDAGGNGDPPLFPPRCYWKEKYQSPEGAALIQDWFAGFRHGAKGARESGYRRFFTTPCVLSARDPFSRIRIVSTEETRGTKSGPVPTPIPVGPARQGKPEEKREPADDTLPRPRPIPLGPPHPESLPESRGSPKIETDPLSTPVTLGPSSDATIPETRVLSVDALPDPTDCTRDAKCHPHP